MKETYNEAMVQVYLDEGGYSNDAADSGGPTKYGITIHDARMYWKSDATAEDVRNMPKSVAAEIYQKHYATPIHYDDLPPGVDYAVLDYGINSGISRAAKVLQRVVGVSEDGSIGPITIAAIKKYDLKVIVNSIYHERLSFLRSLHNWSVFGKGWGRRCATGNKLALFLISKYSKPITPIKKETPMLQNWKTSLFGTGGLLASLATIITTSVSSGHVDWSQVATLIGPMLLSVGMLFAKDFNVTGTGTPVVVAPVKE